MQVLKRTLLQSKMNKDIDPRLLEKDQYLHAINLRVSRSNGADMGVGKSTVGNRQLTFLGLSKGQTIGTYADHTNNNIYYFVTSQFKDIILEYNSPSDTLTTVLESSNPNGVLNFSPMYLITGINIFRSADKKQDLLAWTDNYNSPRILNIERAKTYGVDGFIEEDISVIKKPPTYAPTYELTFTDSTLENNLEEKYLCFAYRYKYLDGQYSALSTFTNVVFAPNTFELDYQTLENIGMTNAFNAVRIGFNTGSIRVTDIQLVFKQTNDLTINIIETFNKTELGWDHNTEQSYTFSNSKIYAVLPERELFRNFDNVPRLAKAQENIGNRLVYGNYVEGYDLMDVNGESIAMNYTLSLNSESLAGTSLDFTVVDGLYTNDVLTIDFSNQELTSNTRLTIDLFLEESFYNTGTYSGDSIFILNEDFADANALAQSADFILFIQTIMTNVFLSDFVLDEPDNSEQIGHTGFNIIASTVNSISIQMPTLTYRIDQTPDNIDDNDDPTTYIDEVSYWSVTGSLTQIFFSQSAVNSSLKTNRSYEIGFVYKDFYSRASTTLTGLENTIYIPQEFSIYKNKIQVTIQHKPPVWATHYNLVIKQNKLNYETIYCTVFYEEGLYRWVKLEGANKDKVKEGDTLILKADLSGVVSDIIKVRVLEVAVKEKNFLETNVDEDGSEIIEESGLYMKIKGTGFDMNYTNATYESYHSSQSAGKNRNDNDVLERFNSVTFDNIADAAQFSGNPAAFIAAGGGFPDLKKPIAKVGAFGYLNEQNGLVEDYAIPSGTKVTFFFRNYESDGYNQVFQKNIIVSDNHDNFQEFFLSEVVNLGDQEPYFDWGFARRNEDQGLVLMVQGEESGTGTERSKLECLITILLVEGLVIFETTPTEINTEIFYETSQTLAIENGNHFGNIQSQSVASGIAAIVELDSFNCFVQGNGAESFKIKDVANKNFLNFDLRPTSTAIEKYRAIRRFSDLTYSAPFVASANINGLNEFNLATANFKDDLDKKYGAIQKLFVRNTNLVVFQEDKVQKILFGKDVLYNADGTSNITSLESVLGQHIAYAGEYGISSHPESVGFNGNSIYFTDAKRGYVLRLNLDGITPISEYGMHHWFKDTFNDTLERNKVGGFDPYLDVYVLSCNNEHNPQQHLTIEFDDSHLVKGWTSFFSYTPDMMVGMNNEFFSFKNGDLYKHHDGERNTFYNETSPSLVSIVFNDLISEDKIFKNLILESNQPWNASISTNYTNSTIYNNEFYKRESRWFAYTRRNENQNDFSSTAINGIGTIIAITGNTFSYAFVDDITSVGDVLFQVTGTNNINLGIIDSISETTITVIPSGETPTVDGYCFSVKNARIESGNVRGIYMRVELTNSEEQHVKLFAINSKIVKSYV